MKMIILYGMPGVGKLTVAKELSKITDYKIFHNHLSYETVFSITQEKDEFFWKNVRKIRYDMIKIASKKNINLILTTCYVGKESDQFLKPLIKLLKKEKIKPLFVKLFCNEKELLKRVSKDSRKKYNKLTSPKILKEEIRKFGLDIEIPYITSMKIDTTNLSAKKTAKLIKDKYINK